MNKNLIIKRTLLFIWLGLAAFPCLVKGQPVDSKEIISAIEIDVINYLKKNENLEEHDNLTDYKRRITIIECVDKSVLGYNKVGVYVFGVNTSHSKDYLLLKNDLRYEMLDPDNLMTTLQKTAALLQDGKISNDKLIEYIESIIRIYKMNENRNPARLDSQR